jgi:hypothetical protein
VRKAGCNTAARLQLRVMMSSQGHLLPTTRRWPQERGAWVPTPTLRGQDGCKNVRGTGFEEKVECAAGDLRKGRGVLK